MSTRRFEAPTLELAAARARAELGPDAKLLSATKVRTGGLGGWFARERVEVEVAVDGVTAEAPGSAPDHTASTHGGGGHLPGAAHPTGAGQPTVGRHSAAARSGRRAERDDTIDAEVVPSPPAHGRRRPGSAGAQQPASEGEATFLSALGEVGAEPPEDEAPLRAMLAAVTRQAPTSVIDLVDDGPAATFTPSSPSTPLSAAGRAAEAAGDTARRVAGLTEATPLAPSTGARPTGPGIPGPGGAGTAGGAAPAAAQAADDTTADDVTPSDASEAGARFARMIERLASEHVAKTAVAKAVAATAPRPPAAATVAAAPPTSAAPTSAIAAVVAAATGLPQPTATSSTPPAAPAPLALAPVPDAPAAVAPAATPPAPVAAPAPLAAPAPVATPVAVQEPAVAPAPASIAAPAPAPAAPAVRRPVSTTALERAGSAVGVLARLGVPGAMADDAEVSPRSLEAWHGEFSRLLADLPVPGALPSAPGAVLAVVGRPADGAVVAASLARAMGTDPSEVVVAAEHQTLRSAPTQLRAPEHAGDFRRSLRWRDQPVVVLLETEVRPNGDPWVRDMLAALSPSQCWGVLDATRKTEDISAWSDSLGGFDALAVCRSGDTASPASVLAADIPVGMLDGQRASASRWADVLCDHLPASLVA